MAIDYAALKNEIQNDSMGLGYKNPDTTWKTDQVITDLMNSLTTGRTVLRTAVQTREIYMAIDDGAWPTVALLQHKLQCLLDQPTIDASNANTRGIIGAIFPASGGTLNTRTRLLALQNRTVSRAEELGLGTVRVSDVTKARAA